jgi:hypothetical protein
MTAGRARARVGLVLLLASVVGCAAQQSAAPRNDALKNWALSRCLAKASQGERAGDDAAKSAAAYLEMSSAGIDVYNRLDVLVDGYLKRTYSGSVKSDYNTMKCIDLYHSKELQAFE